LNDELRMENAECFDSGLFAEESYPPRIHHSAFEIHIGAEGAAPSAGGHLPPTGLIRPRPSLEDAPPFHGNPSGSRAGAAGPGPFWSFGHGVEP
jgi:hypothetical protein